MCVMLVNPDINIKGILIREISELLIYNKINVNMDMLRERHKALHE